MKTVTMPAEPPLELEYQREQAGSVRGLVTQHREFDELLFDLCRADDYAGLYREFVRRFGTPNPS